MIPKTSADGQLPDPEPKPPKKVVLEEAAFGELVSTVEQDEHGEARMEQHRREDLLAEALPVSKKTLLTAALLGLMLVAPYAHGSLERLRTLTEGVSFFPDTSDEPMGVSAVDDKVGEASLPGTTDDQQGRADELERAPEQSRGPIAQGAQQKLPIPPALDEGKAPSAIVDPTEKALDHFYGRLLAAERKEPGALVRIVYYGDSIVASDFITGKLRRLLQTRFGDGGHGYAIAANAFPGWFHIDVSRKASDQWKTSRCIGPYADDGYYGLGCVSFTARKAGEWFSMGTADRDEWGRSVSRFELEYLAQPGGGEVELLVDGATHATLSTDGPEKKVAWHTVTVPDGPHKLEVRTKSDAPVRLYGARMERDVPGVSLSALGITGARARFLDKQDDAHWAEVLKASKPDLVVLAFGTNEITDGRMGFDEKGQLSKDPLGDYRKSLRAVMDQVRAAVPDASLMLVGPPDMASKNAGEGHSRPMVPVIVKIQKELAAEAGWGFFSQLEAMGGPGSMWAWVQSGLGNTDMIHPTGSGGNVLGRAQYLAMMQAYERYKAAQRSD